MKVFLFFVVACCALAQEQKPAPAESNPKPAPAAPAPASEAPKPAPDDMAELSRALTEGGNSPADFTRVLEAHLAKYPNTTHRAEIEVALAKAAMEGQDEARIIKYGELVAARDPTKVELLDRVARAYVMRGDPASAQKGLEFARKFEQAMDKLRGDPPPGRMSAGQWTNELDKGKARALVLESRACGILGQTAIAIEMAKRSYEAYPTAEAAREWSKWLAKNGQAAEAVEHLADAFTLTDARNTELDRAKDRRLMGELYTKLNGSEKGLGDVVLRGYDRTSTLEADHEARLKSLDPNLKAATILDFTLPGANGQDLKLAGLKGKTIVLDFWATWCGPCKAQRPLYQQVEKKFEGQPNVVFLSVNTDEDRTLVPGFLKAQKWSNAVYYDGGLSDYMKVNSIPTTLIVDKTGQISSRMNGFIPERFVDLLTERIQDTLR